MKIDPKKHLAPPTVPTTELGTVSHHTCAEILSAEAPFSAAKILSEEAPLRAENWRDRPEPPLPEVTEQKSPGYIYTDRDLLCIEYLAKLPLSRCIKSNQPADKVIKIHLRSPKRPDSWWGKCPRRLTIGLSDSQYKKHLLRTSLAKAGLLGSLAAFWYGIMGNPFFCLVALAVFVASSLVNAFSPVWYQEVSQEFTSVKGVSTEFLKKLNHTKAHHDRHSFDLEEFVIPSSQ